MKRVALLLAVVLVGAVCVTAASATAAPSGNAATAKATFSSGVVGVKFTVQRFVKTKHSITAIGTVISTFTPDDGTQATTVREPFRAKVTTGPALFSAAGPQKICNVLNLTLDKLSLNLLGLHVDLDKVILNITANNKGGVLGTLFCSLASSNISLKKAALKLTHAANHSGLATHGIKFSVPSQRGQAAAPGPCKVLDLILGPLHLNLLGLVVDLNQVHLQLTAAPGEGVLGDALCTLTH